uniref:Uncharacterized protein n=1 Tax=Trichuris muris TaxID=70415 RepID=A0A5S6QBJ9_TRIMR
MTQIVELFQKQMEMQQQQIEAQRKQIQTLLSRLAPVTTTPPVVASSVPNFTAFDPTAELWKDYWTRFKTFAGANSIPEDMLTQVFLSNQSTTTFKLLNSLAGQQTPRKDINDLSMSNIVEFMDDQYDSRRFVVHERFKFWSDMKRKPGETIQKMVARIRQEAATCDFASINDPQDEALRTRFIYSVGNDTVLKALFKIKDDELTFIQAVQVALEAEDAVNIAKGTVYGTRIEAVFKMEEQCATSAAVNKVEEHVKENKAVLKFR